MSDNPNEVAPTVSHVAPGDIPPTTTVSATRKLSDLIQRNRDFALLLTGSLIAFLGTCTAQLVQTATVNRQLAVSERARIQQEATAIFNDVARHINELDYRQDRVWAAARGMPGAGSFDSALSRLELAVERWGMDEPRIRAQVRAYFGAGIDSVFPTQDTLLAGMLSLVYEIRAANADRLVHLSPKQFKALSRNEQQRLLAKERTIRENSDTGAVLDQRIADQIAQIREQNLEFQTVLTKAIKSGLLE